MKPPAPGSFDYLLRDIDREVFREVGVDHPSPPPQEPPREPPRGPRVRVEIEIIEHRQGRPRAVRSGISVFWWLLLGLMLLGAVAHAQPTQWRSYKQGFLTMHEGNNGWSGRSYDQGFMRYTDMNGPDGTTLHCRSYKQDWQVITECDP